MRAASLAIAVALTLLPGSAPAQEDDRDYLTAFLEDNLSGDNQKVTITGFEGALSSRATMSRLQIADADGVWLTLDDVVLDWSRSSLLSGELEVNELSAATITLDRLPAPATDTTPAPEAGSFALPDLPVSVVISKVDAPRIILGPSLLGEPVEGRFEASLSLISGTGKASVVLERTDGPVSRITLDAGYENASTQLTLDLHATEQAGGIAARMLGLPGTPSVDLAITGAGPLDDFAADVQLASDGVDRLAGKVTLRGGEEGATDFAADLSGDLAPLFLPDYAAFLGDKVVLTLAGSRAAGGRVALDQLQLAARALDLNGSALIAGDGLPLALDLTIRIGTPDGLPVLLPLTSDTRLRTADLTLRFDAAKDSAWSLKGLLSGLQRPDLTLDQAQLTGSGRISRTAGRNTLGGTFGLQAEGLALADMALQQAIGPALSAKAVLYWREGDSSLSLPQLTLTGADYSATAHLRIGGLDSALQTSGKATITAADLRRFAAVAGLPSLAGAATIAMEGEGSTLTGAFDLALALDSTSLRIGISQADRLLSGPARLTGAARRDETGTTLRA
ncbi:MAG: translocation and assembly module protein TamB, partial [Paracoccaceae bacterium]